MGWSPKDLVDYSNEVFFQVGQLVEVDFENVELHARDCTWGIIQGINTRFPLDPDHRKVTYSIRLAGCYILKEFCVTGNIKGMISVAADQISLKEE